MVNNFISYLNTLHNLSPAGSNALAESQVNNQYFSDIYTEFPIVKMIEKQIKKDNNSIIIITGHAGDGKSTIAFDLMQKLDQSFKKANYQQHEYLERYNLNILKDMSELSLEARKNWLAQAFSKCGNWLIVSNTGPLLTSITEYLKSLNTTNHIESEVFKLLEQEINVSSEIECLDDLENLNIKINDKKVFIINIAKLDNIEVALSVFKKILNHSDWDNICIEHPNDPIVLNYLGIKSYSENVLHSIRLIYLYLFAYEKRLTMRQMLAHFSACITAGNSLGADPNIKLSFSDLFFGKDANGQWAQASKLAATQLLSPLNFAGYQSLEIEKLIKNIDKFDKTHQPLKNLIQSYIRQDQNSHSHVIKPTLRRMLFMYDLYPQEFTNAKAQFLNSPYILKYSEWRLNTENFTKEDARHIKKITLEALSFFFSGMKEDGHLNITLKRGDSSTFQTAQIKICSFQDKEFIVEYCFTQQQPILMLKKDKNIRLELSLPLLNYIQNIIKGDITESLSPIYKTQLERFKLRLIDYSEIEEEDEIILLRTLPNGQNKETTVKISNINNHITFTVED